MSAYSDILPLATVVPVFFLGLAAFVWIVKAQFDPPRYREGSDPGAIPRPPAYRNGADPEAPRRIAYRDGSDPDTVRFTEGC